MHSCPECGQECDCSGDWDDISVMSDAWVYKNCTCCRGENDEDEIEEDYDDDGYHEFGHHYPEKDPEDLLP